MIKVSEADNMIRLQVKEFGTEFVSFETAKGRVLARDIVADRDIPPYNRVTMDGIAISFADFENGSSHFTIKGTQAAGDAPLQIDQPGECIEIMTGAALPETTDTVIRYEDLEVIGGKASLKIETITKGQHIHYRGKDKKHDEVVAGRFQLVSPALVNVAASVGLMQLPVLKVPKTVIISSGDELVDVSENPTAFQVRRSNNYSIRAVLKDFGIDAAMLHIPDDPEIIYREIESCLQQFELVVLSGGVSMGKFDYIPQALERLAVRKLFHRVAQRPGKPFWFGKHGGGTLVFAFPGNPVSTFMCLHRYLLPWLEMCLHIFDENGMYAALAEDIDFEAPLQYFMQVSIQINAKGQLMASPVDGNGSGDFANLLGSNAFMELPAEQSHFSKGEVFRIWPFNGAGFPGSVQGRPS